MREISEIFSGILLFLTIVGGIIIFFDARNK